MNKILSSAVLIVIGLADKPVGQRDNERTARVSIAEIGNWWLTFDDDVVPVQRNHGHCPDGAAAEEGTEHAVQLAHERPWEPEIFPVKPGGFWNRVRLPFACDASESATVNEFRIAVDEKLFRIN